MPKKGCPNAAVPWRKAGRNARSLVMTGWLSEWVTCTTRENSRQPHVRVFVSRTIRHLPFPSFSLDVPLISVGQDEGSIQRICKIDANDPKYPKSNKVRVTGIFSVHNAHNFSDTWFLSRIGQTTRRTSVAFCAPMREVLPIFPVLKRRNSSIKVRPGNVLCQLVVRLAHLCGFS